MKIIWTIAAVLGAIACTAAAVLILAAYWAELGREDTENDNNELNQNEDESKN